MSWDVFISHASEDKDAVARPLAESLQTSGYKVWYDESTLTLGDNLRRSIEHGLANSRFGIVILSPSFFAKKWPQLELDGLFALERPDQKKILPVWHNVTASDVERFSSFLAMRLGVPTSTGLENVVKKIIDAINRESAIHSEPASAVSTPRLHPHSIEMLQVALEANGEIMTLWHLGGFSVTAGNKPLGHEADPRAIALNLHCLEELVANGLADRRSEHLCVLTQEGFDYQIPTGVTEAPAPQFPTLTEANLGNAKELMKAAVAGNGRIMSLAHLGGHVFQAGGRSIETGGDRRAEARWNSVLNELVTKGLLLQHATQSYLVSHLGFLWTDTVNKQDAQK
ncbi:MAG TPA: toll/interleukin-1 receptor domain-containing protein [Gemmataceae bacterium]|jgi:hypothetical protein